MIWTLLVSLAIVVLIGMLAAVLLAALEGMVAKEITQRNDKRDYEGYVSRQQYERERLAEEDRLYPHLAWWRQYGETL